MECQNSKNLIPELEENIPKLQKLLLDEEKVLEEIKENFKGDLIFFLNFNIIIIFIFLVMNNRNMSVVVLQITLQRIMCISIKFLIYSCLCMF